jgi:hypothetical protein
MSEEQQDDPYVVGMEIGIKSAVSLARHGSLRIKPRPYEKGTYPYTIPFKRWRFLKWALKETFTR